MSVAPIALFAYRRPKHLRRVLDALRANPEAAASRLYVFSDGAKGDTDAPAVEEVRQLIAAIPGFADVQVAMRDSNAGLARSIIDGVSRVVADEGRVIVMEDDLVVSPHFLRYMNDGLDVYAHDQNVASIHGYAYPVEGKLPETFFLKGADCWGWATWLRAWKHFEPDGKQLQGDLRRLGLTDRFDWGGSFAASQVLDDQIAGRNDSWAIRWHASALVAGMYTLYPARSLVRNIGFDGSGTHAGGHDPYAVELTRRPVDVARIAVQEDPSVVALHEKFFRTHITPAPRAHRLSRLWRRVVS